MLDLGSTDAADTLEAEALREGILKTLKGKCERPDEGEGARGEA